MRVHMRKAIRVPDDLLVHLRRARDLADRRYGDPLDLDALAATAGVSKYHFLRCFAAVYGTTPARGTSPSGASNGRRTCCAPPT